MRHQRPAGLLHLFRYLHQVVGQPEISAQFVGQNVQRRLQHAADRRNRAALAPHPLHLRAERGEVFHHRHAALHERQVVAERHRLTARAELGRDPRQPRLVQEPHRVGDQLVVLLALHERGLLGRLAVLKTDVGLDVDARHAVVGQPRRLRQPGPDVHHVRHGRVPVVVVAAAYDRLERLAVIVRHLLAREARMPCRDLGGERPQRHAVRHTVVHRAHVARHPRGVQFFH